MIARTIALILCLVLPPVGVYLARGAGISLIVSLALTAISAGVFLGLYAGPGLALFGLAVLHALLVAVLPKRPVAAMKYQ